MACRYVREFNAIKKKTDLHQLFTRCFINLLYKTASVFTRFLFDIFTFRRKNM